MVKKISIVGSGAVGSGLAFHLLSRLNLKDLILIDIAADLAKGTALDLEDTRAFLKFTTQIQAGSDYALIKDSDIIVITAGIARKDGMTRLDLLKINAGVAREVSQKIKTFVPSAIVIVVTNPLDLITYVVGKETGFSRNRVFGMGSSLDSARLLNIFSQMSGFPVDALQGFAFGLHNNNMVISAHRMKINSEAINKFLETDAIKKLQEKTSLRGGEIVGFLKTKSAHFAPSLACCHLIEAIAEDKKEVIPVSVLLSKEYGLDNVCVGVPCVIAKSGIEKIIELDLTAEEQQNLNKVKEEFKVLNEINL